MTKGQRYLTYQMVSDFVEAALGRAPEVEYSFIENGGNSIEATIVAASAGEGLKCHIDPTEFLTEIPLSELRVSVYDLDEGFARGTDEVALHSNHLSMLNRNRRSFIRFGVKLPANVGISDVSIALSRLIESQPSMNLNFNRIDNGYELAHSQVGFHIHDHMTSVARDFNSVSIDLMNESISDEQTASFALVFDGQDRWLICAVDHLIFDDESISLFSDILIGILNGDKPTSRSIVDYQELVRRDAWQAALRREDDLAYWRKVQRSVGLNPGVRGDFEPSYVMPVSAMIYDIVTELDIAKFVRLQANGLRNTSFSVYCALVLFAIARSQSPSLHVEGFNTAFSRRGLIGGSQEIGSWAEILTIALEDTSNADWIETVEMVGNSVRNATAHAQIPRSEIVAELADSTGESLHANLPIWIAPPAFIYETASALEDSKLYERYDQNPKNALRFYSGLSISMMSDGRTIRLETGDGEMSREALINIGYSFNELVSTLIHD